MITSSASSRYLQLKWVYLNMFDVVEEYGNAFHTHRNDFAEVDNEDVYPVGYTCRMPARFYNVSGVSERHRVILGSTENDIVSGRGQVSSALCQGRALDYLISIGVLQESDKLMDMLLLYTDGDNS